MGSAPSVHTREGVSSPQTKAEESKAEELEIPEHKILNKLPSPSPRNTPSLAAAPPAAPVVVKDTKTTSVADPTPAAIIDVVKGDQTGALVDREDFAPSSESESASESKSTSSKLIAIRPRAETSKDASSKSNDTSAVHMEHNKNTEGDEQKELSRDEINVGNDKRIEEKDISEKSEAKREEEVRENKSGTNKGATAIVRATDFDLSKYDYSKSSEENYASLDAPFVGKYGKERSNLDYSFHRRYSEKRQLFHDQLIDAFLDTVIYDGDLVCDHPTENWIVFTAGPMGAGKGHTLKWLDKEDYFPMKAFVNVDPDEIRKELPETAGYNARDQNTAGFHTQKEVGYISEVLSYDALRKGKNVLVDGSLRNAMWYLEYFRNLKAEFPILKIAIINITAKPSTVIARANARALVTGRFVPEEVIRESMRKIPESLAVLSPHCDFVVTFENEGDEPRMRECIMREHASVINNNKSAKTSPIQGSRKGDENNLPNSLDSDLKPTNIAQNKEDGKKEGEKKGENEEVFDAVAAAARTARMKAIGSPSSTSSAAPPPFLGDAGRRKSSSYYKIKPFFPKNGVLSYTGAGGHYEREMNSSRLKSARKTWSGSEKGENLADMAGSSSKNTNPPKPARLLHQVTGMDGMMLSKSMAKLTDAVAYMLHHGHLSSDSMGSASSHSSPRSGAATPRSDKSSKTDENDTEKSGVGLEIGKSDKSQSQQQQQAGKLGVTNTSQTQKSHHSKHSHGHHHRHLARLPPPPKPSELRELWQITRATLNGVEMEEWENGTTSSSASSRRASRQSTSQPQNGSFSGREIEAEYTIGDAPIQSTEAPHQSSKISDAVKQELEKEGEEEVEGEKEVVYIMENFLTEQEEILDDWKDEFTRVWEMHCAMPPFGGAPPSSSPSKG